jgi:2-polyprenyl-6-methoxyphenol hydroxylase-like FAD-dependent oxidoreductase
MMTTSTAVIHWNHRLLVMCKEGDDCVKLKFTTNGTSVITVQADLVIAANGIRSTVLQTWLPSAPLPKSLGVQTILGLTENIQHLVVDE